MPPSPTFCSTTRIIFLQCEDRLASGLFCALRYCSASSPMLFAHFLSYCLFLLQQKGRSPCCRQCPALLAALTVVSLLNPKSLISHFPMRQRGNPETAGEAGWGGF